ncbi:MAG: glycosyltransferase [Boseongicola sp.]|nr:glycosyltransferase [Boseongicola sp.]MDD9979733.1 glycosyltransferase [Boseongicola sp.]
MIPKIIHYVWVGTQPKPDLVLKCIQSWKQFCPDYEIVEWGNEALAKIDNVYVQEAAAEGKWAFVSDYIRLHALYERGGFYCDSDLEVTASLEPFRDHAFVTGYEKTLDGKRTRPITALMGSIPKDKIMKSLLSDYEGIQFMNNGVPDMTPNTDRITRHFKTEFGLTRHHKGEETVHLDADSVIYPYYFFCTPKPGEPNYSIHHFNGSWIEPGKRKTLLSLGGWQLLKFTFNEGEDTSTPLRNNEHLVLKASTWGKRVRTLALIRWNRAKIGAN